MAKIYVSPETLKKLSTSDDYSKMLNRFDINRPEPKKRQPKLSSHKLTNTSPKSNRLESSINQSHFSIPREKTVQSQAQVIVPARKTPLTQNTYSITVAQQPNTNHDKLNLVTVVRKAKNGMTK